MNESVRPARPHQKLTEDGRTLREVLTYARRGNRLDLKQQEIWDKYAAEWVIPDEAVDDPGFSLDSWFGPREDGQRAPLVVDIGGGVGEATAVLAAARPAYDILGLEVWRPGVADSLERVAAAGATNVRFCSVDALWTLENLIPAASVSEVWTFFPDPWHKTRHHKRRLVAPANARMIAERLKPGGVWRLATDWVEYAEQMIQVLDAEPLLTGGAVERWDERPVTRFERKGLAKDRVITDLLYRR